MKLTKKLRHSIYVEALKVYKEECIGEYLGLCFALSEAIGRLDLEYKVPWPYEGMEPYSEVYKHIPSIPHSDVAWFNFYSTGIQKRISILEQAIKKTEYEKKTTKSKN